MAEPAAVKARSKHSWCWRHFTVLEGTGYAACQLRIGAAGAICGTKITASSDKLKQHLETQLHGMTREKSAMLWQAQQDEIAAVLAGVPAPPNGGQTQLSFTPMPRGAVTLASLTTAQQDAAARDMMLVIVDELRPWSLFEDQTTAVKADADPRMSLRRFLLKYRPDLNVVSRRTLVALRSAEYTAQKALVIACLKTLPVRPCAASLLT